MAINNTLLVFLTGLSIVGGVRRDSGVEIETTATFPCDDPGTDPWVGELRDRVARFDDLYAHAVDVYGPPVACDGRVTDEFDGRKFGTVRWTFVGGVTFEVQTQPPETSFVTLRTPAGFDDPESARQALEAYTAGRGLAIDWTSPTETVRGGERVQRFRDPEPGLNASASLTFAGETLVAMRFSMAL